MFALPPPLFHSIGVYTGLPHVVRQACKKWRDSIDQGGDRYWWGALFNAYVQHPFFVLYTKRALTLGNCQDKTMRERVKEVFRLVVQDAKALRSYNPCQEPLSIAAFERLLGSEQQQVQNDMRRGIAALRRGYNSDEHVAKIRAAEDALTNPAEIHDWFNDNQGWLRERGKVLGHDQWNTAFHYTGDDTGINLDVRNKKKIYHLMPEIGFFYQLIELDVSHNELTHLPEELSRLTNLRTLDIRRNSFKELPAVLLKLATLTSLDIGSTDIRELPEEIANLSELQTFHFDQTGITSLPKGFEKLRQLSDIRCHYLIARILPKEKFPQLAWINGVPVEQIPEELAEFTSLAVLPLAAIPLPEEKPCKQTLCEFFARCFSCIAETITSWLSWLIAKFH